MYKHQKKQRAKKMKKAKPIPPKKAIVNHTEEMRAMGQELLNYFKDKDMVNQQIHSLIDDVIDIFSKYDTVQLLGSVGLRLMDNLPNIEKMFIAQMNGQKVLDGLDEDAEVIAEYAMNFALAMPNTAIASPSKQVVQDLYDKLKSLKYIFSMKDMPTTDNCEDWFTWVAHGELVSVRGDGYQIHVEEVFQELFKPHSPFFESEYGFSFESLFDFLSKIENRIYSKIGDNNSIYGAMVAYDRWRSWTEKKYGEEPDIERMLEDNVENPMFGAFLKANPDMAYGNDLSHPVLYQPDDFSSSDKIFWIVPENDQEGIILETLSTYFGENSSFIAEGEYKGNIMSGPSIFTKPIIKIEDRYYCFTPMILHRNMFTIAEALIKAKPRYYDKEFQTNVSPFSRDNYIERKVKEQFEMFLPDVRFHASVNYIITEDGVEKRPELDILGISDNATYIIEVKAHELSHKDRVGIHGLKKKFTDSITSACSQAERAKKFILTSENPTFNDHGTPVHIDAAKPIYKVAVTFQHYSMLIGNIRKLIDLELLTESDKDTWIISLFDLMVFADYCDDETEFLDYLDMRKDINAREIVYTDEIGLYSAYITDDLKHKLSMNPKISMIQATSDYFDQKYSGAEDFPFIES